MSSIQLYSERPIRMELPPVSKEQQQKFSGMAKASMMKINKIFSLEKPNQQMTKKEQENAYFMMYAAIASRGALEKNIPMKKATGEKFQAPVAEVMAAKLRGVKEATKERLVNWQVSFTSGLQERIPEVSLSKQREYGQSVSRENKKEKDTFFSLDDTEFDFD